MDVTGGNSGNLGTGEVCLRTMEPFNTVGCSNFTGRTLTVNGVAATCGTKMTFPAAIGGYNYFEISAGGVTYASIFWYSS
jgi:endoglucanase